MKIIDLLNKIANGEISEDTIVEFDNGYKDYCSIKIYFDRYVMDRENLNNEVEIIEEEKKIPEKIRIKNYDKCIHDVTHKEKEFSLDIRELQIRYNDLLDYLKSKGE